MRSSETETPEKSRRQMGNKREDEKESGATKTTREEKQPGKKGKTDAARESARQAADGRAILPHRWAVSAQSKEHKSKEHEALRKRAKSWQEATGKARKQ